MRQNAIEKIVQRYAVGLAEGVLVRAEDFVTVRPLHVMTHDNSGAVLNKFQALGAKRVFDPSQPVFALDHDVQNTSESNLSKYERIEAFARQQGIAFHPAGRGIGHQIMAEEGFALPGALVVGSDSHSNLYGALSALGTPVVRTDAAAIWATGTTWWQVPKTVRVNLLNKLRQGVSGKDVILSLIALYRHDEVLNHAIEFHGPGVRALSMDARMTIANMTTEWGALAGWFPFDEGLRDWLHTRARHFQERGDEAPRLTSESVEELYSERVEADEDAWYAKEIDFDLSRVSPYVAGPDQVKVAASVAEMEPKKIKVDKAFLLSCVNSRLEDLQQAAAVLRGKRVADGVQLYLAAASSEIESAATADGSWQALLEAGAIPLPPGCGPCIGLGQGTLEENEVGISATNRNFKGRMGNRSAQCYLASPAVVAASAVAGYIAGPSAPEDSIPAAQLRANPAPKRTASTVRTLEGFPERLSGRLLFLPQDNLNTDGIYGKDWTYRDDMKPQEMAEVAMLNYDPKFQQIAKQGDILVGGKNFGSGSSREQAATALKFRGIQLILAASFSETYKRNAFNNGILVVECPELVVALLQAQSEAVRADHRTIPCPGLAEVDFLNATVSYEGANYVIAALSSTAQELVLAGGSEGLVRQQLARQAR